MRPAAQHPEDAIGKHSVFFAATPTAPVRPGRKSSMRHHWDTLTSYRFILAPLTSLLTPNRHPASLVEDHH